MFQSLHALLGDLEEQRNNTERTMGHREIGVASCMVFDELIRRVRVVTDVLPADGKITLSVIRDHADDGVAVMTLVPKILRQMGNLINENAETVYEQRQPFNRLIGRIESEGYAVDIETLTDVSDPKDWSVLDAVDDAAVRVQLEAEKIARAEQAAIYQKRLKRMDAAIRQIESRYAQQLRDLAKPTFSA